MYKLLSNKLCQDFVTFDVNKIRLLSMSIILMYSPSTESSNNISKVGSSSVHRGSLENLKRSGNVRHAAQEFNKSSESSGNTGLSPSNKINRESVVAIANERPGRVRHVTGEFQNGSHKELSEDVGLSQSNKTSRPSIDAARGSGNVSKAAQKFSSQGSSASIHSRGISNSSTGSINIHTSLSSESLPSDICVTDEGKCKDKAVVDKKKSVSEACKEFSTAKSSEDKQGIVSTILISSALKMINDGVNKGYIKEKQDAECLGKLCDLGDDAVSIITDSESVNQLIDVINEIDSAANKDNKEVYSRLVSLFLKCATPKQITH